MNTMKNLFLLPIFALALCVTSCGEDESFDDSKDTPVNKVTKKLMSMRCERYGDDDDEGKSLWEYVYDSNGNVISIIKTEEGGDEEDVSMYNFKWGKNGITFVYKGEEREYYTLEDGRIVRSDDLKYGTQEYYYTYDASGHVISCSYFYEGELKGKYNYVWSEGKLMNYGSIYYNTTGVSRSSSRYEYSEKTTEGFAPSFHHQSILGDMGFIDTAMPGLIGAATQNLPSKIQHYNNEGENYYTMYFTYEFYSDGYLKSVIIDDHEGGFEKITYTWE